MTGSLVSEETQAIVPVVVQKVKEFDGNIIFTQDTHTQEYMTTQEGQNLPVEHCILESSGSILPNRVTRLRRFNRVTRVRTMWRRWFC